jgi:hypothetical protein
VSTAARILKTRMFRTNFLEEVKCTTSLCGVGPNCPFFEKAQKRLKCQGRLGRASTCFGPLCANLVRDALIAPWSRYGHAHARQAQDLTKTALEDSNRGFRSVGRLVSSFRDWHSRIWPMRAMDLPTHEPQIQPHRLTKLVHLPLESRMRGREPSEPVSCVEQNGSNATMRSPPVRPAKGWALIA